MVAPKRSSLTQQASVLLLARFANVALRFLLPILLVRAFDKSTYGLYRQLILVEGFAVVLATGLEASFFYFVPQFPERRRQLVFQTLAVNGGIGLLFLIAVSVWRVPIAQSMNNPALAAYLPLAGMLVFLGLSSDYFGDLLIAGDEARLAALTVGGIEFLRVTLVAAAALVTRSVMWMMIVLVIVSSIRPAALLFYVALRIRGETAHPFSWRFFWEQVGYSIPLGLSSTVSRMRGQVIGFFVSALFTPAAFAVYSVGATRLPFASPIFTVFSDVIAPRMTEYRAQGKIRDMLELWHRALLKLGLPVFPMLVVATVLAEPLIVVTYTEAYRESVPVFIIFNLSLLVGMFPYGSIIKAFGETRFIFLSNLMSTALMAGLAYPAIKFWGPIGAAGLIAGAMLLTMGMQLVRIRKLLGVSWGEYFPWAGWGKTMAAALIPGAVVLVLQQFLPANLWTLISLLALYGLMYLLLLHVTGAVVVSRESLRTARGKLLGRPARRREAAPPAAGTPVEGV